MQRVDGMIAVSVDRAIVDRWSPEEIDRLLLFGNVQISTQVLALLLESRAHVSFFTASGRYRRQLVSPESGNVFLRLAQHARYSDRAFRMEVARGLVCSKIRASRAFLRRYARNHAEIAERTGGAADKLDAALARANEALDEATLLQAPCPQRG